MPEYPLTPSDVRLDLSWLLELTWASQIFRFATDAVNIIDVDSNILPYLGGLRVQFSESMSLFSPAPVAPRLSIRGLQFPVDVAELIEKGNPMVRVQCELSMHVGGDAFERRKIRFKGQLRATDYGEIDESVSFTLTPNPRGRALLIPDADAMISQTTWPNHDEIAEGEHVPIVIGNPGLNKSSVGGIRYTGGSPALTVDGNNDYLAISEKRVNATNVVIIDTDAEARTADNPVVHRSDALGREFATIEMDPAAAQATYIIGNEYQVDWSSNSGSADAGGGILNPFAAGALRGAGDVARWGYNLAEVEVDHGRWAAVADTLNAFLIDTYIDDPTDLPRWIEKELLPLLPLAGVLHGPNGIYPVLWNRFVHSTEVVADIDVVRDGLSRQGPVRYEDGDFGNELKIQFAPRGDNGRPSRRRTRTGRDVGSNTSDVQPQSQLRSSQITHGRKARKAVTTAIIRDNATALRILAWQAAAFAFPWRMIDYRDDAGHLAWLRPGDPVLLTDDGGGSASLWLTSRLCWVQAVSWQDVVPTYTLVLIDSPARDIRPT